MPVILGVSRMPYRVDIRRWNRAPEKDIGTGVLQVEQHAEEGLEDAWVDAVLHVAKVNSHRDDCGSSDGFKLRGELFGSARHVNALAAPSRQQGSASVRLVVHRLSRQDETDLILAAVFLASREHMPREK